MDAVMKPAITAQSVPVIVAKQKTATTVNNVFQT
jgi:hypothetical protein